MDGRDPSPWAGVWYFLVTIFSFGLLAWVPFVHAAGRLRRRSVVVMAVVYAVGAVTSAVLMSGAADAYVVTGNLLMLSMVVVGCVHQAWLRRQVYRAATPDPALAAVIATTCGLSQTAADSIVVARTRCGGFLTVDDLFSMADVPVGAWETIRDRGIVIPLAYS
jgi:hypothetical protein